jgi:hypothetical protein
MPVPDHAAPGCEAPRAPGSERVRQAWGGSGQEPLVCAHAHRTPNSKNHPCRPSSSRRHSCGHSVCLRGADERLRLVRFLGKLRSGQYPPEHHSGRGIDRSDRPSQAPPPRKGRLPRGGAAGTGQDLRMHCHDSRRQAAFRSRQNAFRRHHQDQQRLRRIRGEVGRGSRPPAPEPAAGRDQPAVANSSSGARHGHEPVTSSTQSCGRPERQGHCGRDAAVPLGGGAIRSALANVDAVKWKSFTGPDAGELDALSG